MTYGTIHSYLYRADVYCPQHIAEALAAYGEPVAPGELDNADAAESMLDDLAGLNGIDREDERTFDSGVFPKVILYEQATDHPCGHTGCTNLELESR